MPSSTNIHHTEVCQIPRWAHYKATLHNMDYEDFFYEADTDLDGVLLDVRTPDECQDALIKGAINLNYLSQDLADQLEKLNKSKTYYIFCRTGRRSLRVCMLMKNTGFKVVNLDGGLMSHSQ